MWTKKQIYIIAILMVFTGSLNTLSTQWADRIKSKNSADQTECFNHPFLQACLLFLGEVLCLIVFKLVYFYGRRSGELEEVPLIQGNQNFNVWIFFPPVIMDMLAASIMYVGLNLTFASLFPMLRGAVIVFTGLLSVVFLKRTLKFSQWFGIFWIILGLGIVGTSDFVFTESHGWNSIIAGDLLIVMAQIISATQVVYEEKFVNKYNVPPIQAVGWEGVFGFTTLGLLLIPMYFIPAGKPFSSNPRGVLEDAIDGFIQLYNSGPLIVASIGAIVSIAFFKFAGMTVAKELSATTRMVLDSTRTLVIWVVSLIVTWQTFNYLQVIGFALLIVGMCLYNKVIIVPTLQWWKLSPARGPTSEDISLQRVIKIPVDAF